MPERRVRAEVSLSAVGISYEERSASGTFLDGETGWLPTLAGAVELHEGSLFLHAGVRLGLGSLDYDGHVQSSSDATVDGLPARSTSGARFFQGELQAGGFLDPGRRVLLFSGVGARRWDRDIRPTMIVSRTGVAVAVSGLGETYSWYELQLGVRSTMLSTARVDCEVEGRLVRTFYPRIAVDAVKLRTGLGERTGFRVGATLRWTFAPNRFLSFGGGVERYAFGASNVIQVAPGQFAYEPSSETWDLSLDAGVGGWF